jgi:molybdenum cofactor synthesis domain-containing protein
MKFLKTISVKEFNDILNSTPNVIKSTEYVPLESIFNRVIAEDIRSNIDVPHFRKSRMDGYAVIAEDTFPADEDNVVELELIEKVQAGDIPQKEIAGKQCAYVATGAAVPEGANAVLMVEFTEQEGTKIKISKAVPPGTHIVNIGHDMKKGDVIVTKDSIVNLATLGMLASCGIKEVPVLKQPLIALLSTGNEIVNQDVERLDVGKIYDVNSIVLKSAIEKTGSRVKFLGIIKDNFDELKGAIDKGLSVADIVIVSGGTSKGEGDVAPTVLDTYDYIEIYVHGVRIKPGKPIIFVKLQSKYIFILPGFPTSALSCFFVFIENFLRRMAGFPLKETYSKTLEVGERIYSTVGRHEFKTVRIVESNGVKKIYPVQTGSEAISTIFHADGYIEIEELESIIEKGDKRIVYTF